MTKQERDKWRAHIEEFGAVGEDFELELLDYIDQLEQHLTPEQLEFIRRKV